MRLHHFASLFAVLTLAASARAVVVTQASFESPDLNDSNSLGVVDGWVSSAANVGVFDSIDAFFSNTNGDDTPLPAPADQGQMLFTNNIGANGFVTQAVGTVSLNTTYTLTVAVGQSLTQQPFGNYLIQLLAGATVIATANDTTPAPDTFVDVTAVSSPSFTDAFAGQTLSIRIAHDDPIGVNGPDQRQNFYDNVRLTESVPEPASAGLVAAAAAVLAAKRRRRA